MLIPGQRERNEEAPSECITALYALHGALP